MPHEVGDQPRSGDNTAGDVNHGSLVQIGTVHGGISVPTEPTRTAPHQIPTAPHLFTDRVPEFRRLQDVSCEVRREERGRTVLISGTGGVGKTALATRFLDTHSPEFTDGMLYADLQGFTESGPVDTGAVLDSFLRSLHLTPESIPHGLGARAAAYRSHTHGRSLAVLLDNVVSAAQVRQLTPGQGPHLLLATTRLHLTGLRLDGAAFLEVHPLHESEAVTLVDRMLSDDRVRAEPESVRQLITLCGRLPLAMRAAASGLTARPNQPLSRMVSRLSSEQRRLTELSQGRELSVSSVFTASYALLSAPARRLYRLLGLLPGRDLTLDAAAALAGAPELEAEDLLTELIEASLLEESPDDRFRQHDLVRLHARGRAEEDEDRAGREAARDRLLRFYLATAAAADRTLNPHRWHLAPVFEETPIRDFASRDEALGWLESELECLQACVKFAHWTARHPLCWQLCETMANLFIVRKHFAAWEETTTTGLASAEALGEPEPQGRMLGSLAGLQRSLGRLEQAHKSYHRALGLWQQTDHVHGRATALEGCGMIELAHERPRAARSYFQRALEIYERIDYAHGATLMLRRLGRAANESGDQRAAVGYFQRALTGFDPDDNPYQRLRSLVELAATHQGASDHGAAGPVLQEGLALARRVGAPAEEARIRTMLAGAAQDGGQPDLARDQLTQALSIYKRLGAPQAAKVRERLESLPPTKRV